tara:strand:- start:549 stop:938 length:390 start_codon:yes stop_codon:yes gene_type:complete
MKIAQVTKDNAAPRITADFNEISFSARVAITTALKTAGTRPSVSIINAKQMMLIDKAVKERNLGSIDGPLLDSAGTKIAKPKNASINPSETGIIPGPILEIVPIEYFESAKAAAASPKTLSPAPAIMLR